MPKVPGSTAIVNSFSIFIIYLLLFIIIALLGYLHKYSAQNLYINSLCLYAS